MSIASRLADVRERIARAAIDAGRDPSTIALVAVSKRHPASAIREAYAAGQRDFGENYVQELVEKASLLADLPDLRFHLIGHLQSNKAKVVAPVCAAVQTVDSVRLATMLAKFVPTGRKLVVHLQVNVGGESQKSGCAPADLAALVDGVRALPELDLVGLMTIPPEGDRELARRAFRELRSLANRFDLPSLSMGMSADLDLAVAEGATIVRVGTAIFGDRA